MENRIMVKHSGGITIKENATETKINCLKNYGLLVTRNSKFLHKYIMVPPKKKSVVTEEPNIRVIKSYTIQFK